MLGKSGVHAPVHAVCIITVWRHRAHELGIGINLSGSLSADLRIVQSDSGMETTREVARGTDGVWSSGTFRAAGLVVSLVFAESRRACTFVLSSH